MAGVSGRHDRMECCPFGLAGGVRAGLARCPSRPAPRHRRTAAAAAARRPRRRGSEAARRVTGSIHSPVTGLRAYPSVWSTPAALDTRRRRNGRRRDRRRYGRLRLADCRRAHVPKVTRRSAAAANPPAPSAGARAGPVPAHSTGCCPHTPVKSSTLQDELFVPSQTAGQSEGVAIVKHVTWVAPGQRHSQQNCPSPACARPVRLSSASPTTATAARSQIVIRIPAYSFPCRRTPTPAPISRAPRGGPRATRRGFRPLRVAVA